MIEMEDGFKLQDYVRIEREVKGANVLDLRTPACVYIH